MLRLVSLVTLALLLGIPTHAQGPEDKTARIDKIFSWATLSTPGCTVAVAQHGKVLVERAYGSADLERNVPLTPASVFDAGSLVKQFVAASTLLLADEGKLSLSDDVRKHVPELPDYGATITVDHLLTHTSGLRDWTGLLMLAEAESDALTMVLRQRGLNFAPGEEWAYSNSGYVLLKEIVARRSGMSFAEFTRKRLFEPLGMKSTAYTNDLREVVKNRAIGYDRKGGSWRMDMLLDNERGGGGALLSTAGDLLIWNEALTSGRLGAFVTTKIQEPATLKNGRKLGYARGLFLDMNRGGKVVWHSGSAAGYKSLLARFPEQALSVGIMCNSGDGTDRMAFAARIYDLYVPGTRTPAADAEVPAAVEGLDLQGRTGLFFSEKDGEPLRLGVDDGRLRVAGGPRLLPLSADRFRVQGSSTQFMSDDEFELRFLSNDQLELKSMEGKTTLYRRAQHYSPTPSDLQAFAGRFRSDELRSTFDLTSEKGGLVLVLNESPEKSLELRPVDRDTFQAGRMTVRFRRDANGSVVALDYSNPLLRNVRFTRLGDGTTRGQAR